MYEGSEKKSSRLEKKSKKLLQGPTDAGAKNRLKESFLKEDDNLMQELQIRPGRYRHFKGGEYRVLYLARHSETQEWMVVYQALYGEHGIWVRPAAMWEETVERDGYLGKRFTYIGE